MQEKLNSKSCWAEPVERPHPWSSLYRHTKRMFDIIFAAFNLVLLGPVMLVIGTLIKLDCPGPVLYKQRRIGVNGKPFDLYKFRTMVMDAEERIPPNMRTAIYSMSSDPRVTRIGRLLRRTALDELPQLFNVLRGDMSIVGPRPELPWVVEKYDSWQDRRFLVRPGITGVSQVSEYSGFDDMVRLDTWYVEHASLWLDLAILFKTVIAAVRGRGEY